MASYLTADDIVRIRQENARREKREQNRQERRNRARFDRLQVIGIAPADVARIQRSREEETA